MLVNRVIEVENGNTLDGIRNFVSGLLATKQVDRLFAPVDTSHGREAHVQIIANPEDVSAINPLLPLMLENAAVELLETMRRETGHVFAALLRPCEVRAVVELAKQHEVDTGQLVVIGVDCLATYDNDFYQAISDNHPDDPYWLMHESLRFAHVGQIASYRYRDACRFCDRPAPDYQAVDILLGVIGVNTRKQILVIANDQIDRRFRLDKLTDHIASDKEVIRRETTLWRLSKWRKEAAENEAARLGLLDGDMVSITGYLNNCTLCGHCIEACPLCDDEICAALGQSLTSFIAAFICQTKRLASCAACGMCQAHCPEGIPLSAINYVLTRQAQAHLNYLPGRDVAERIAVPN